MASELRLHSRLLPVTIPVAEADCPVLHSVPDQGRLDYAEGLLIGYRGYDRAGTAPGRPVRTLAAFAAATAEPGQAAEVRLAVPARAFARYDEASGCWVRSAGEFIVRVGRSSADLRLSVGVRSLFFRTDRRDPGWDKPRASRGIAAVHYR